MRQFSVAELLRNTNEIEDLISVVENGHPSIDESHHCWKALKKLETMELENIYKLYEEVNQVFN
ncbi:hypothetical protein [Cytobacillus praedii]|uniref:Uncharacterized protein n=1 Tax=Cytobacillus praedii TaxID=1742358 RepID=A0A4R1AU90_9BACI|nr:hypothetical protein [Cytobacillus praedii]TCJ00501.1 hypothetical protein E0Y62_26625 [Cytobacillus praedii]